MRKRQGWSEGRGIGELWVRDFTVVSAGRSGETVYAGLGLACLSNFNGLCGTRAAPGCLGPATG